jgi:hypothetical protein
MAVVCGDKMFYGVWAETNGDDGPKPMIGEASISIATACYGHGVTGNNGHIEDDVLYIAFTGRDAVPGADGADWAAPNADAFMRSIQDHGDRLVKRIGNDGSKSWNRVLSWTSPSVLACVTVWLTAGFFAW